MSNLARQELYDKIKQSSKDEYILSEMKRLGYWKDDNKPSLTEELIQRKGELQREIRQLSRQIQDPKAALKQIHQQRMAQARQQRIDTKVSHDAKRYQRALEWHQRKQETIEYLGDACALKQHKQLTPSNAHQLAQHQLPACDTAKVLAQHMGVSLNELRFLCYTNQVSTTTHYQRFGIQKKTGGVRYISAPMPRLKRLQYWILDNILYQIPVAEQAHGFIPERSILTNAIPHIGKQVVVNLDLENFFPTVSYPRIKGLFLNLGYNDEIATLLSLLCSEPDTQTVELDGQRYHIHSKRRFLPQGAPTSPAISNLICRQLDKRLQGLAQERGFSYTRYADDLSFSSNDKTQVISLLSMVKHIVSQEGFILHPDKTRIMHAGSRQEVTGIVVNEKPSLNRKTLKQFRALLFQLQKDGYSGKHWHKEHDLLTVITGFAHYVRMIKPEQGQKFLAQIAEIRQQHGTPDQHTQPSNTPKHKRSTQDFRQAAAKGQLPLASMTVATPAPQPTLEDCAQHPDVLAQLQEKLELSKTPAGTEHNHPQTLNTAKSENTPPPVSGILETLKRLFGGQS